MLVRIPLDSARPASEIAARLADFVPVRGSDTATPLLGRRERASAGLFAPTEGGTVVVRSMREEDEFAWRGLRLTLVDVSGPAGEPDTATFVIDSATSSQERSIQRLRSIFFEDFRIRVVDITGGGRVTVEITDVPTSGQTTLR